MNLFSLAPSYEPHLDPARVAQITRTREEDRDHINPITGQLGDNPEVCVVRVLDADGQILHARTFDGARAAVTADNHIRELRATHASHRPLDFATLTRWQVENIRPDQAIPLIGPWWIGHTGHERLDTPKGRGELHRVWLRHTYNSNPAPIPDHVLDSHALEEPSHTARCWFARALAARREHHAAGADLALFAHA